MWSDSEPTVRTAARNPRGEDGEHHGQNRRRQVPLLLVDDEQRHQCTRGGIDGRECDGTGGERDTRRKYVPWVEGDRIHRWCRTGHRWHLPRTSRVS
ncbi:hypothetical protein MSMEI_4040 [Mycolicibacterium smegmatis MC2 155]|uniref:Uncharacterized protein n=1 Tax=Mycolicibacterium smegmatis (strain ATCC 700084 / mc(2)155) TaxID=246196 RepID=I7FP60_MYCS2|nr:hypothetical protein MSMEI_4040 [Mycolicibacterium smegmatis MC2 155]